MIFCYIYNKLYIIINKMMENCNFGSISICSRGAHLAKLARNFFALGSFLNRKEALESRESERWKAESLRFPTLFSD